MTVVYKATFKHGKCYIGITNDFSKRKYAHRKKSESGYSSYFYNAIRKYGFDSITWEILYRFENRLDAESMEIKLIAETKPNYNVAGGGNAAVISEEAKKKISKTLTGRIQTEEQKRKRSASLKLYYSVNPSKNKDKLHYENKQRSLLSRKRRSGIILRIAELYKDNMTLGKLSSLTGASITYLSNLNRVWDEVILEEGF